MKHENPWIEANWPCPPHIKAITTLRFVQDNAKLRDFNLSPFNAQDSSLAQENESLLRKELKLARPIPWLKQVHGNKVLDYGQSNLEGDGMWTDQSQGICAILTADCLPVVLTDKNGELIAALHGGWRGLAANIIAEGVKPFKDKGLEVMAWLGPCIGPKAFEVGEEVLNRFQELDSKLEAAFKPSDRSHHYLADLYQIARILLNANGVNEIYGGGFCTLTEKDKFYSYRRNPHCGRMATLIWKTK